MYMKNKTNRKSLKKNRKSLKKKLKGGAECLLCGDRTSTRTEATSVSLCGKPQCRICIDCARQSCTKGAEPQWKNYPETTTGAVNPKCPFCNEKSENVTNKCLEITGKNNIDEMVNWNNVLTYEDIYGEPQSDDDTMSVDLPLTVEDLTYDDSGTGISQVNMERLIISIDLLQSVILDQIPKRINNDIDMMRSQIQQQSNIEMGRTIGNILKYNYNRELGNIIHNGSNNPFYSIDTNITNIENDISQLINVENYISHLTNVMSPEMIAEFIPPIESFKETLRYIHEEQPNINATRMDKIFILINERLFTGELKTNVFQKIMENGNNRVVANTAVLAEILYSIVSEHLYWFASRILMVETGGKRKIKKNKTKKSKLKRRNTKKKSKKLKSQK